MRSGLIAIAVVYLSLAGCKNPRQATADAADAGVTTMAASATNPLPVRDAAKAGLVCKAGIAKLFQQPAASMSAEPLAGGITRVSYRRSSDNTLWKNDCRVDGNRIVWRAVDASPGSGPGRWRDDPADGLVTYTLHGERVEVVETF